MIGSTEPARSASRSSAADGAAATIGVTSEEGQTVSLAGVAWLELAGADRTGQEQRGSRVNAAGIL